MILNLSLVKAFVLENNRPASVKWLAERKLLELVVYQQPVLAIGSAPRLVFTIAQAVKRKANIDPATSFIVSSTSPFHLLTMQNALDSSIMYQKSPNDSTMCIS